MSSNYSSLDLFATPMRRSTSIDTSGKARAEIVPVVSVISVVYCPFLSSRNTLAAVFSG